MLIERKLPKIYYDQLVVTGLAGANRSKKKMADFACYSFAVSNFDEQQKL